VWEGGGGIIAVAGARWAGTTDWRGEVRSAGGARRTSSMAINIKIWHAAALVADAGKGSGSAGRVWRSATVEGQ